MEVVPITGHAYMHTSLYVLWDVGRGIYLGYNDSTYTRTTISFSLSMWKLTTIYYLLYIVHTTCVMCGAKIWFAIFTHWNVEYVCAHCSPIWPRTNSRRTNLLSTYYGKANLFNVFFFSVRPLLRIILYRIICSFPFRCSE